MKFRIILPTSRHRSTDHFAYYFFYAHLPYPAVRDSWDLLSPASHYRISLAICLYAGLDGSVKDIAAMIVAASPILKTMD
jgi:hypothetical protein